MLIASRKFFILRIIIDLISFVFHKNSSPVVKAENEIHVFVLKSVSQLLIGLIPSLKCVFHLVSIGAMDPLFTSSYVSPCNFLSTLRLPLYWK